MDAIQDTGEEILECDSSNDQDSTGGETRVDSQIIQGEVRVDSQII